MPVLTQKEIMALAPDVNSAKAANGLASAQKWQNLGNNDNAAWGEFQGSAKKPYQTCIDLTETAFKCTCPSRKFPCKHALGLFLLLSAQPKAFSRSENPDWVNEWLKKRSQKSEITGSPKKQEEDKSADKKKSAQAKRAKQKEQRVSDGLNDLELWLADLMRRGFNAAQTQPLSFWETPASRLVDAQAPGLAGRLREMAAIPSSGAGWQNRLLEAAADLYLVLESYRQLPHLAEPLQEDIRTTIGWTIKQADLLGEEGLRDTWLVLGKRQTEEPMGNLGRSSYLKVQRNWLIGQNSRRSVLVLNFAAPGQNLEPGFIPGTSFEGTFVFYPGSYPLRAVLKERTGNAKNDPPFSGYANLELARKAYSLALSSNPWLDLFPMPLEDMIPVNQEKMQGVRDENGFFLPFHKSFNQIWKLVSLSGGHPISLFGEWDGYTLLPLCVWADGRPLSLFTQTEVISDD